MARLIAYARQSDPNEKDQTSLQNQIARVTAFATLMWHTVVVAYMENHSGASSIGSITDLLDETKRATVGRRAFAKAMKLVQSDFADGIIVFRLDRFSRNMLDNVVLFDYFKRKNKTLLSMSEMFDLGTAAGEMMANMLATFAQLERRVIIDRLTQGKLKKQQHGGIINGASAYGCKSVKKFVGNIEIVTVEPDERELAVIAEILDMYNTRWQKFVDSGCKSFRSYCNSQHGMKGGIWQYIADSLNERGIPAKRGGVWRAPSIRAIVVDTCQRRAMLNIIGVKGKAC